MNLQPLEQFHHEWFLPVPADELEHVQESHRGGGLVTMHLRPQQHLERSSTEPHVVDGAAFDRGPDLLYPNQIGRAPPDAFERFDDILVAQQGRLRQREMLGVPGAAEPGRWRRVLCARPTASEKQNDNANRGNETGLHHVILV